MHCEWRARGKSGGGEVVLEGSVCCCALVTDKDSLESTVDSLFNDLSSTLQVRENRETERQQRQQRQQLLNVANGIYKS